MLAAGDAKGNVHVWRLPDKFRSAHATETAAIEAIVVAAAAEAE